MPREARNEPPAPAGRADVAFDEAGVPVVKLVGEVDMSNVDTLRRRIDPEIDESMERVVFDLSDLSFMDSSGIAMLLQIASRTGTVEVLYPTNIVRRIIEATGLSDVLRMRS